MGLCYGRPDMNVALLRDSSARAAGRSAGADEGVIMENINSIWMEM